MKLNQSTLLYFQFIAIISRKLLMEIPIDSPISHSITRNSHLPVAPNPYWIRRVGSDEVRTWSRRSAPSSKAPASKAADGKQPLGGGNLRWRFPARHGGTSIAGWFISWKIPSRNMDDWGVPLLLETMYRFQRTLNPWGWVPFPKSFFCMPVSPTTRARGSYVQQSSERH